MRQARPLRTLGLLALVSIAGLVGQLFLKDAWGLLCLGLMLTPVVYAALVSRSAARAQGAASAMRRSR